MKWKVNERFLSAEAIDIPDDLRDKHVVIWQSWNGSEKVSFSNKVRWPYIPVRSRCVISFFLFWLSQNDMTGVETIKDLFTSQGLTSPPASSSLFKAVFTICERD